MAGAGQEGTNEQIITPTTSSRRHAERGSIELDLIKEILDRNPIGHLATVHDGYPIVIPVTYLREAECIYIHGAAANATLKYAVGSPCTFVVTELNALVLAPSMFDHSVDYRSVVAYGVGEDVSDPLEKDRLLTLLVERLLPGRPDQLRASTPTELLSTRLIRLPLDHASAKVRNAPPSTEGGSARAWIGRIHLTYGVGAYERHAESEPNVPRPQLGDPFSAYLHD